MLVNGMGCYFPGWGVSIWDRVLVNGIECSYIGCVSKQDGLLVYGMRCSFRGWGICIWHGLLVYGMGF